MAHMIENNQLAYVGAEPWHGLGFKVAEGTTGAEMLKVAGLDWKVQRRALAMRAVVTDSDGRTKIDTSVAGGMLTSQLADFRAIVRSDNNQVFQVASAGYEPHQNSEIVDFFREYCEAGHASMETVGGLRGGAVVWALARLNGGSTGLIGGDDELRGYMLLATSHDGSLRTIGKPTQVRVVCHNTLTAAFGDGDKNVFSMKHTRKFGQADKDEAARVMGMASKQVSELNDIASQLAKVTVDHAGWMEFIGKLVGSENVLDPKTAELARLPQAIQDATISSPGAGLASARGTMWGLVNGVTYYADHAAKSRSESNRLFSAWFGSNESLKNTAVRVACEMAGINA